MLLFIEEEINVNQIFNTIQEYGIVCNFEKLKPVELIKRLNAICIAYNVKVDYNTLMYLIETSRDKYAGSHK